MVGLARNSFAVTPVLASRHRDPENEEKIVWMTAHMVKEVEMVP